MNRERARELLPIIQAFADGETIEVNQYGDTNDWKVLDYLVFSGLRRDYRIKPQPREFWANTKSRVIMPIDTFEGFPGDPEDVIRVREVMEDES